MNQGSQESKIPECAKTGKSRIHKIRKRRQWKRDVGGKKKTLAREIEQRRTHGNPEWKKPRLREWKSCGTRENRKQENGTRRNKKLTRRSMFPMRKRTFGEKKNLLDAEKKNVVEQSEAEAPQIFRRGGKAAAYQKEHVEFTRVFSHGGSVRSLPLTAHEAS